MKLGCNIWSYNKSLRAGKIDHIGWFEKCAKELNLDGVEILDFGFPKSELTGNIPNGNYLKKVKKLCTDLNLEIYLVSCANGFGYVDQKKLAEQIEYVKKWIDIGFYFGAPVVRCFSGSPQPKEDKEGGWKSLVKGMKVCTDYAELKGIVLALENHGDGAGAGFISTSDDVLRLFKEVGNSPWLKLCLDTGNYSDLYVSIEKTANLATVIHAKTYEIESGVEKKLDYEKIFKIMKKVNFRGYWSIEYEGENDNDIECMENSVKFLRKMIAKYS